MKWFKHLISISAVVLLIYIFTFYIDGEMGVILLAFMIIAPILSLVFALLGKNAVEVSFDCDGYVKKGSNLLVNVVVEKKNNLPLAFIDIKPAVSEVFEKNMKTYRISMLNENKKTFSFTVNAVTGGNGEISIESVYSCGFMGFVKFKSKMQIPLPKIVGVIPEIPQIKASSQLFRSISDVVMTSDDDEENDTAMMFSANTTAGYEHREYIMGDPLKRINWKLSTKKSKLMVRLDEAVSSVQPSIILDLFRKNDTSIESAVFCEEKLIQSVFGLLSILAKQGIACNFTYYGSDGTLVTEVVDNPDYPAQLLLKVLSVKVVVDRRINIQSENSVACVIATTDTGNNFTSVINKIEDKENTSVLVVSQDSPDISGVPLWYLNENNDFVMV